jgi:hypothetical protein
VYVIDEVIEAIVNKSVLLLVSYPEERYATLQRRRIELGGMLELARRLDDHRLVRVLERHKDELTRQIEAL